jgi:hypothetical protein
VENAEQLDLLSVHGSPRQCIGHLTLQTVEHIYYHHSMTQLVPETSEGEQFGFTTSVQGWALIAYLQTQELIGSS